MRIADLTPYSNKRICVAVSGGKDSMALLHCLNSLAPKYGILLSAVNLDHCMRGEESARDSAFVREYCSLLGIPLYFFSAEGKNLSGERSAREWRLSCFDEIIACGKADFVATAHHMNDNAETVLFNLARGSALCGLTGISSSSPRGFIRPLIGVSRAEIDEYIAQNGIPYVTDSTNLKDEYTRNKIRHLVIPALESAVGGAVANIYRFSRLAAEDEEYLSRMAEKYICPCVGGYVISPCAERVLFRRAVHAVVAGHFRRKDYTSNQFDSLYELQNSENGKKFVFLGLCAVRENGGIAITELASNNAFSVPFIDALNGEPLPEKSVLPFRIVQSDIAESAAADMQIKLGMPVKALWFDLDKIPADAVIRARRQGDKFTKFGGGTKSLGNYLTDKKIAQSLRDRLPLIAEGGEVLAVGGVEISDRIKLTDKTAHRAAIICPDASAKYSAKCATGEDYQ